MRRGQGSSRGEVLAEKRARVGIHRGRREEGQGSSRGEVWQRREQE